MGMMPLGLTEFDGMIRSELIAEIERLRAELYMRDKMELHEVVMKLVGPVMPAGETREDERRLENMKALTELKAHKDAAEQLGRHRELQEAESLLRELVVLPQALSGAKGN